MLQSVTGGVMLLGEELECGSPGWRGSAWVPHFNIGIFSPQDVCSRFFFSTMTQTSGAFLFFFLLLLLVCSAISHMARKS